MMDLLLVVLYLCGDIALVSGNLCIDFNEFGAHFFIAGIPYLKREISGAHLGALWPSP